MAFESLLGHSPVIEQEQRAALLQVRNNSFGEMLNAGFEVPADRECPPVYSSDGITCIAQPPTGTWFAVSSFASYVNDPVQCHSGKWCGAMTLEPTIGQVNVMWDWVHTLPQRFYVQGWWKFPKDWQWNTSDVDHKIILLEPDTESNARMYLNLRTDTADSQIANVCITTNAYLISHDGFICANRDKKEPGVRADGVWHSIQAYVDESGDQAKVWLDGALVIDTTGLDFADAAPYKEVKFGAYMGGAAASKKGGRRTFYVDDLCVSASPCGMVASGRDAPRGESTLASPDSVAK